MKTLLLPALILIIGGCVVQGSPDNTPVAVSGNVNLVWTFSDGESCSRLAGTIDHLVVHIPGEQLQNGGIFPCEVAGTQGIELTDFAPGNYSVSVTAVAPVSGEALYTWSGSFTVNGDVQVDVLLVPVAPVPQPGNVTVVWSFNDGQTCAGLAGLVDHIQITIPGEVLQNAGAYPCEAAGTMGIVLDDFSYGDYNLTVEADDASGSALYSFSGSFTVDGDVRVVVPLAPTVQPLSPGNITFLWTFGDGNSCASLAGIVSSVQVSIPGEPLQNNGNYPCDTAGSQGIEVDDFTGGDYAYTIDALDSTGSVVYSDTGTFQVNGSVTVDVTLEPNHP